MGQHARGHPLPLTPSTIGVILGSTGVWTPTFLDWEDIPPIYKYTKSEILLGPPYFSDQSYATAIDRNILVIRFSSWLGICGSVLSWFKSYLTSRSFRVKCNNNLSSFNDHLHADNTQLFSLTRL